MNKKDKRIDSYIEKSADLIIEAKTEETRNRRIETSLEWISEEKGRNWKYLGK